METRIRRLQIRLKNVVDRLAEEMTYDEVEALLIPVQAALEEVKNLGPVEPWIAQMKLDRVKHLIEAIEEENLLLFE